MFIMLGIKKTKDGGIAFIFGKEFVEEAKQLYPLIVSKLMGIDPGPTKSTHSTSKLTNSTLGEIKMRVECENNKPQLTLKLNAGGPLLEEPDYCTYVRKCLNSPSDQVKAYNRIYAEIYSVTNINLTKERQKLEKQRQSKPHGQKGPVISISDVVRANNLNQLALDIAKKIVKEFR
jgi:hypothetical protein